MDVALALLVLWTLLFVPIGLLLHWLVLGPTARVRALPLAPITGIAIGFVVFAALRGAGVRPGEDWVPWVWAVMSLASVVAIWRLQVPWRSRELIGMGFLLLLAVVLVQLPVLGESGEGPLGYGGSSTNAVTEVATIEAASGGTLGGLDSVQDADRSTPDRYTGFEQFAAFSVAIGQREPARIDEDASFEEQLAAAGRAAGDQPWSAYTLHSPIAAMLAALVLLPLFAFARARGVRTFGLIMLVPLGVLAPATFLALASGAGAAAASVPFVSAAAFSLLVTRRDRGWWSLVALYSCAVLVAVGPLGLLPIACVALAWTLLRSGAYEHLAQLDRPVSLGRMVPVAALSTMLAAFAVASAVLARAPLAWPRLHEGVFDALVSWPFAWLGTDLRPDGPDRGLELAIWAIAPALLAVAVIYAVVRNERRELAVLVGAIAAAVVALGASLADSQSGVALLEYVWLVTSPLLAAMVVRAVALARANADEQRSGTGLVGQRRHRLAGTGPTLLVVAFAGLSISATGVTGTRMVHAPVLLDVQLEPGTTLIAAGDPWLAFVLDGERTRGGYTDADQLSGPRPLANRSEHSITYGVARVAGSDGREVVAGAYRKLVLGSSPLSSDPTRAYLENSDLDAYAARLFYDRRSPLPTPRDVLVDGPLDEQRRASSTARRSGASKSGEAAAGSVADVEGTNTSTPGSSDAESADGSVERDEAASENGARAQEDAEGVAVDAATSEAAAADVAVAADPIAEYPMPLVHTPVEDRWADPAQPAGLLVPPADVPGCTPDDPANPCLPEAPVMTESCTTADREAARSALDIAKAGDEDDDASDAGGAGLGATGGDDGAATDATPGSTVALGGGGRAARRAARAAAARKAGDPDEQVLTVREGDELLPEEPSLLGVACFDVELAQGATALVVHLRDVGVVLGAEHARTDEPGSAPVADPAATSADLPGAAANAAADEDGDEASWTLEDVQGGDGVLGGWRRHGSRIGSRLVYGSGRLTGLFDVVVEGSFGAGVGIGSAAQPDTAIATINGSADGFGPIKRQLPLQGGVVVTNSAGTSVELGRVFARPLDLPRACDVVLPLDGPALREMQTESRVTGDAVVRPGFTAAVVRIDQDDDGARTARIAVGSYLSRSGLPRHLMVDWTEQFESAVEVEGCDGTVRTEGATPGGNADESGAADVRDGDATPADAFGR